MLQQYFTMISLIILDEYKYFTYIIHEYINCISMMWYGNKQKCKVDSLYVEDQTVHDFPQFFSCLPFIAPVEDHSTWWGNPSRLPNLLGQWTPSCFSCLIILGRIFHKILATAQLFDQAIKKVPNFTLFPNNMVFEFLAWSIISDQAAKP